MTEEQERQYLCELIMSASEWRLSEGDERDTLRLEIQDRLRRLNGVNTEDENGYIQSEPVEVSPVFTEDDYKDPVPDNPVDEPLTGDEHLDDKIKARRARKNANAAEYRKKNVRVHIDGKPVWKRREECIQVPTSNGNFRWEWRPDQAGQAGNIS